MNLLSKLVEGKNDIERRREQIKIGKCVKLHKDGASREEISKKSGYSPELLDIIIGVSEELEKLKAEA